MGLARDCWGGLDGVESLDPDREEVLLDPPWETAGSLAGLGSNFDGVFIVLGEFPEFGAWGAGGFVACPRVGGFFGIGLVLGELLLTPGT